MTSAEIRQSFLDFFGRQGHTIVPSSSLLPDSPGLLFTNAGMNQFVPIFLGDRAPDVSKWAGVRPGKDTRAADTQKCIRAGGKHNDLEDVGFDTYHHTLFEMLGNWSFGDYFKRESLEWGWELLTKVWGIPAKRLFATVYRPRPGEPPVFGEPGYTYTFSRELKSKPEFPFGFDFGAYDIWAAIFQREGLDPERHIVFGNKKDNFWMMGDTGPCGPCSEIHFNLLPDDDEDAGRKLVNVGSPRCIEIWNHVFIQFNANEDGSFSLLAQRHVDTGMGFERVAGIYATTKGFKDFSHDPSNYAADVFAQLFDRVEKLSGKRYAGTVPKSREGLTDQENTDVAFRVLADHARCVSCAIADGILPSNEGRNYVIRRILRRGILYGKKLGLPTGFFEQLVAPVVESLGGVFPELAQQQDIIRRVIRSEEESFGRTIDRGIEIFNGVAEAVAEIRAFVSALSANRSALEQAVNAFAGKLKPTKKDAEELLGLMFKVHGVRVDFDEARHFIDPPADVRSGDARRSTLADWNAQWRGLTWGLYEAFNDWSNAGFNHDYFIHNIHRIRDGLARVEVETRNIANSAAQIPGEAAFKLYDTYGFPLDMTQLLATERGLTVGVEGFDDRMAEQKKRSQTDQAGRRAVLVAATEGDAAVAYEASLFTGYVIDTASPVEAIVSDVVRTGEDVYLVFDRTPFYAEMGGQAGDTGSAVVAGRTFTIVDTIKDKAGRYLHKVSTDDARHSALVTRHSPASLLIDLSRRRAISRHHSAAHLIHWALRKTLGTHVRQAGTSKTPDRMRFDFSHFEALTPDQLKEVERLVNERVIDNARVETYETEYDKRPEGTLAFFGDKYGKIVRVVDIGGYSRELCGGTHVTTTGEIGLIKVVAEMAIAAGTRRIEAVAGQAAYEFILQREAALAAVNARLNAGPLDVAQKLDSLIAHQKELEKKLKSYEQKASAGMADELASKAVVRDGLKFVTAVVSTDSPESLRSLGSQVLAKIGDGVVQLGAAFGEKASVVAFCSPAAVKAGHQAGKLVNELSQKLGGKGGGKPDFAMGGGKDVAKLNDVLRP